MAALEPSPAEFTDTAPAIVPVKPEVVVTHSYESGSADNLQLYLREIGQVKLLTPAEEIVPWPSGLNAGTKRHGNT